MAPALEGASYTYDHLELGDDHSLGCKCCRLKNGDDLPVPKKVSLERRDVLDFELRRNGSLTMKTRARVR